MLSRRAACDLLLSAFAIAFSSIPHSTVSIAITSTGAISVVAAARRDIEIGRCLRVTSPPWQRITARSIAFRNSRTFPGQECDSSCSRASSGIPAPDGFLARRLFSNGVRKVRQGDWTMADDGSLYTLPLGTSAVHISHM